MFGLKFQTITVESAEPLMTCLRLGLITTVFIVSLWPLKDLLSAGSVVLNRAAWVLLVLIALFAPKDDVDGTGCI